MAIKEFTVDELVKAGCGKYVENRTPGWDKKKQLYMDAGIWVYFNRLRNEYKIKFTNAATGIVDTNTANRSTQAEVDAQLIKRARGEVVALPGEKPEPTEESKDTSDEYLVDIEHFGDMDGDIDLRADLMYVYKNIDVKNPDPKKAPSSGAYAYLKHVQTAEGGRMDFYNKQLPKILPKETDKNLSYHDDMREQFKILERLTAEA
jgi:hypothetical protein